ncbi:thioesterase [Alphaproteobacteria bacterium 46_93_T64]|nr:thioesterase [Alphaproteobacteria bacterium 46_93_T64]
MARSDFRFFHDLRVRYSEIDGQGVVFNAHYLTYFDVAITEYFRGMAFDYSAYAKETGLDFHLVKSLVNYAKPILFDAEIQVGCRTAKIGNSSLTFILEVFEKESETIYSSGEIIWVNTDQSSHKTVRIGDNLRELIDRFEDN